MCRLPYESGPCRMSESRWFYDTERESCQLFTYGGCQGNGNNFERKDECVLACGGTMLFFTYTIPT